MAQTLVVCACMVYALSHSRSSWSNFLSFAGDGDGNPAPTTPKPPAFDTAAARGALETTAIPARRMG
jgi:hypothetical protein